MLRLIFGLLPFLVSMALDSAGDNSNSGDNDSDNTGDAPGKKGGSDSQSFTQTDVDRVVGRRLDEERARIKKEIEDGLRKQWEDEQTRKQQEEAQQFKPLYETEKAAKEAAEKRVDEVAGQFRTRLAKVEIEKAATEARLAAPKLAYRLIDFEGISFDEEDAPTNIPALVTRLAEDNPDLVKPEESNRNGINPVPGGDNTQQTKDDIKKGYLKQAGVEV